MISATANPQCTDYDKRIYTEKRIFIIQQARRPADRRSLVVAIMTTVAVAAVTNGALQHFGINQPAGERWPAFAPRGFVIGMVWIALFAGMGTAYWFSASKRAVLGLIMLCLAYPFYTHIIGNHATELIGNIVTFAYAIWLITVLRKESRIAALLIGCVAAWVVFATALVIGLVQLNGWAT